MENFDWDGFIKSEFIVNCKAEEGAKNFLNECFKRGLGWIGIGSMNISHFGEFWGDTCYIYCENKVGYNSKDFFKKYGYAVD